MAAYINAHTDRCFLKMHKTENPGGFLALQTQICKTLVSKGAFVALLFSKTSRCASSTRPVLLEKGATDLLRRMSLVFRGVVAISSTLDRIAPTKDDLS